MPSIVLKGPDDLDHTIPDVEAVRLRTPTGSVTFSPAGLMRNLVDRSIVTLTAEDFDGADQIGSYAFAYCRNLRSAAIPQSVTAVGYRAFYGCRSLRQMAVPETVQSFGLDAYTFEAGGVFEDCVSLTDVTFAPSTYVSGKNLFSGCEYLAAVTLSQYLIGGASGTFNGCSRLTSITIPAANPPAADSTTFTGVPSNCAIYVPAASVSAYKAAAGWSARSAYIQAIPT